MEDAMVINRGSLQRGFAHGQVYTSKIIDLKEIAKGNSVSRFVLLSLFSTNFYVLIIGVIL